MTDERSTLTGTSRRDGGSVGAVGAGVESTAGSGASMRGGESPRQPPMIVAKSTTQGVKEAGLQFRVGLQQDLSVGLSSAIE
ncbi:MAG TPA: hypothetical protein VMM79_15420 [Longimicrobiales bacterium]|nr:hypothetical protein [Longimicrobiales bacterium]